MAIPEKDIKKLWGRAAGRCSKPGCGEECVKYLDAADPTVIGEMAHIIAARPAGPRGVRSGGDDTYGNTMLLCPTHHTEIDKAPDGVFTVKLLHEWKSSHEKAVSESFQSPVFRTSLELAVAIKRILEQNKVIWELRILVIPIIGTGFIRSPDFPNATCPMVSL